MPRHAHFDGLVELHASDFTDNVVANLELMARCLSWSLGLDGADKATMPGRKIGKIEELQSGLAWDGNCGKPRPEQCILGSNIGKPENA